MRSSLSLVIFSSLLRLTLASQQCSTQYASTSTTRVLTSTKTVTTTSTTSVKFGTTYLPSPSTISYTVVPVSGKKTTTVPTGPSFTPIISAPNGPPPEGTPKRAVRNRAAPTKYPNKVFCTLTLTSTTTKQVPTATGTYTQYITKTTATSTKRVATSTAYAACRPSNIVSTFKGQPVNSYYALGHTDVCDYVESRDAGEEACANLMACCGYAQANQWAGFVWMNSSSGVHCVLTSTVWGFNTGDTDTPMYIGNGPEDSGYYGVS